MSILNRILGGSSEDSFKTATPLSIANASILFSMGAMPKEYILMLVNSSSISVSTTPRCAFICHTTDYNRVYQLVSAISTATYKAGTFSNISASYSNGVFTITSSAMTNTGSFNSNYSYILFYR